MRTIGIDLGTTNTVAAIEGTTIQHAAGVDSSPILPSVVAFPPSGAVLAGQSAKKRRAIDPKNTIYSAKRLMGQRWLSYATTQFRKQYPFDLIETGGGGSAFRTRAGDFTPVEIGAKLMEKVFAARLTLRQSVAAVVTVPAAFEPAAREATRKAVELSGIASVRVIEEPVATAMAYLTTRNERLRHAVVYDLGGGTFDLAVVDCSSQPARVIRHAGDPYLGGDDIDRAIAQWVAEQVLSQHGWDLSGDPEVFDRLVLQCERMKIRLSTADEARLELGQIDPAAPSAQASVQLTRQLLVELAQPFVSRTFILCDQVLREAGLKASQIDAVYLAGGTTLMPLVREGVANYFGSLPRCDFDPLEVVAIGASLAAD
jgi:molecular chaperone DnaK